MGSDVRRFRNAEAAFQALKYWSCAELFGSVSGEDAVSLKTQLGAPDVSYAGFANNWNAMWHVLRAKFQKNTRLAQALEKTEDAFLLEHNECPGRDNTWSDDYTGEGQNWLGLQLMLLRDELRGT